MEDNNDGEVSNDDDIMEKESLEQRRFRILFRLVQLRAKICKREEFDPDSDGDDDLSSEPEGEQNESDEESEDAEE